MELQVRIASQGNLEEREFTNNETGQKEKFATMPFVLQHGSDRIYCEMVQEQTERLLPQLLSITKAGGIGLSLFSKGCRSWRRLYPPCQSSTD